MKSSTILPGTGRGTIRRMVEGAGGPHFAAKVCRPLTPSVSAAPKAQFILSSCCKQPAEGRCHLPTSGEDLR